MPVTPEEVAAYAAKIERAQREARSLTREARNAAFEIVERHRLRIRDAIADAMRSDGQLTAVESTQISQLIKSESKAMVDELLQSVGDEQTKAFTTAVSQGQQIAREAGVESAFFTPTTDLLTIAKSFTADYVRTIEADLMRQVNPILQRAALGGMTPFEAMKGIDAAVGRGGGGGASYQAERIVRTEVNRVYQATNYAQLQAFSDGLENPKLLKKTWLHGPVTPNSRQSHVAMDRETVAFDEKFSNGLMYPHDPRGGAAETINCTCTMKVDPASIVKAMEE